MILGIKRLLLHFFTIYVNSKPGVLLADVIAEIEIAFVVNIFLSITETFANLIRNTYIHTVFGFQSLFFISHEVSSFFLNHFSASNAMKNDPESYDVRVQCY